MNVKHREQRLLSEIHPRPPSAGECWALPWGNVSKSLHNPSCLEFAWGCLHVGGISICQDVESLKQLGHWEEGE